MQKKRLTIEDKFIQRMEIGPPNDCWIWQGSATPGGYGFFTYREAYKVRGMISAHRASWVVFNGDIPAGLHVLHKCDNPSCINPRHLWLGTHADNMADKAAKGRASRHNSKKTHCLRGHEYSPENTYVRKSNGSRVCRTCSREIHNQKKKAKKVDAHYN